MAGVSRRFTFDQSDGKGSRRVNSTRVPLSSAVKVNVCRWRSFSGVPIGPPDDLTELSHLSDATDRLTRRPRL
jgi:hypothetical protein